MKITMEVIPDSCLGRNLHSDKLLINGKWEDISRIVRVKGVCQCCGERFSTEDLNSHEVWEFNVGQRIQRLVKIVSLCTRCHNAVHYHILMGNPMLGEEKQFIAKAQYIYVNKCTFEEFERDLDAVLEKYRILNNISEMWYLDISHIVESELAMCNDINMDNLEKIAPGSKKFLEPYQDQKKLSFNVIPDEYLKNMGRECFQRREEESCELCGEAYKTLYTYYNFKVKKDQPEMVLAGKRQICDLCWKTIYHGAKPFLLRWRKTTRHYMKVNKCSYKECKKMAKKAREDQQEYLRQVLYVYLKMENVSPRKAHERNKYLYDHGARFDSIRKKWYLRPVRDLMYFKSMM